MDLQKLIESHAKATETQARPAARAPKDEIAVATEAINRPIEVQQAQADRVQSRIESLEASKAALLESIDSELKALKEEHKARTRTIETERTNLVHVAKAVADAAKAKAKAKDKDKGKDKAGESKSKANPSASPDKDSKS